MRCLTLYLSLSYLMIDVVYVYMRGEHSKSNGLVMDLKRVKMDFLL